MSCLARDIPLCIGGETGSMTSWALTYEMLLLPQLALWQLHGCWRLVVHLWLHRRQLAQQLARAIGQRSLARADVLKARRRWCCRCTRLETWATIHQLHRLLATHAWDCSDLDAAECDPAAPTPGATHRLAATESARSASSKISPGNGHALAARHTHVEPVDHQRRLLQGCVGMPAPR